MPSPGRPASPAGPRAPAQGPEHHSHGPGHHRPSPWPGTESTAANRVRPRWWWGCAIVPCALFNCFHCLRTNSSCWSQTQGVRRTQRNRTNAGSASPRATGSPGSEEARPPTGSRGSRASGRERGGRWGAELAPLEGRGPVGSCCPSPRHRLDAATAGRAPPTREPDTWLGRQDGNAERSGPRCRHTAQCPRGGDRSPGRGGAARPSTHEGPPPRARGPETSEASGAAGVRGLDCGAAWPCLRPHRSGHCLRAQHVRPAPGKFVLRTPLPHPTDAT